MTLIQAIILGIVQGATEFFPVSSSAHLKIAKWFLGVEDHGVYFDLMCHAGSLLALLIYLRGDVWEVLKSVKKMGWFALALAPLVPGYFLMKPVRQWASQPEYLGYFLMATGLILYWASKKKSEQKQSQFAFRFKDVVCVGLVQTMALIPGISRSGSTISAGRLLGWTWLEAARFSFLLAIPTILGGELLETMKLTQSELGAISPAALASGFIGSFLVGLVGVRFIFWVYKQGSVRPFAWYCMAVGLFAWVLFRG